jgi:hypothetical protein
MSSDKPSARAIAGILLEGAQMNLKRDGRLYNLVICSRGTEMTHAPLDMLPREAWPVVGKMLQREPFDWLAHICEGWSKTLEKGDPDLTRAVSTYDDRKECIILALRMSDGKNLSCMQEFNRDDQGQPVFDQPPQWAEGFTFDRVLDPPEKYHEHKG